MSAEGHIVVLNCGSSSIKFGLFARPAEGGDPPRQADWRGQVQGIGGPKATLDLGDGSPARPLQLDAAHPYVAALAVIRTEVLRWLAGRPIAAVAHRVVHGGPRHFAPVRVDAALLAELKGLIPLAPLHQPFALEAMEILLRERPDLPQVACFDTGFHHTLPVVEQLLPLPYAAYERGLRRYGFHGLSYEYMAVALAERHGPLAQGRTLVAHLGSGASLCAMQGLQSVATTMGFSALDGLMMGTRTGALDPGAVLYLMEIEQLTVQQVGQVLYHDSGLLGISGLSADPRVLLAHEADEPRAALALQLYVRRIVREVGALVAVMGGLDLLVFTAGIGEHSAVLRQRIVQALAWLGLALDEAANAADAPVISAPGSAVRVAVEPTHEEWISARHAARVMT
ncbi:acetate/propionate family kinase [Aquincola tertiaricarbonis]|uniref:Acetate kinase n=1 Tax=Aquincola tertiaricarbonis TaxID=391953 RepID=A0ABY4S4B6_AQUTE|nr:acetate/propionate family kinase [Aquincola tertiaricarbonis]URI07284.1 acetate/propionate family kinase [Aquincola tertiaricarbonis]